MFIYIYIYININFRENAYRINLKGIKDQRLSCFISHPNFHMGSTKPVACSLHSYRVPLPAVSQQLCFWCLLCKLSTGYKRRDGATEKLPCTPLSQPRTDFVLGGWRKPPLCDRGKLRSRCWRDTKHRNERRRAETGGYKWRTEMPRASAAPRRVVVPLQLQAARRWPPAGVAVPRRPGSLRLGYKYRGMLVHGGKEW